MEEKAVVANPVPRQPSVAETFETAFACAIAWGTTARQNCRASLGPCGPPRGRRGKALVGRPFRCSPARRCRVAASRCGALGRDRASTGSARSNDALVRTDADRSLYEDSVAGLRWGGPHQKIGTGIFFRFFHVWGGRPTLTTSTGQFFFLILFFLLQTRMNLQLHPARLKWNSHICAAAPCRAEAAQYCAMYVCVYIEISLSPCEKLRPKPSQHKYVH